MNKNIVLTVALICINARRNTANNVTGTKTTLKIKHVEYRPILTTINTRLPNLQHIDYFKNLAQFDDADVRGPNWYDYGVKDDDVSLESSADAIHETLSSSSEKEKRKRKDRDRSDASSKATSLETIKHQRYRLCPPCPEDMMKRFTNLGIKWICGAYHRARRTFKSSCMMRFRNCQDGTMFVKIYDRRCKDNPYHGKHFFYQYPV